MPAGGAALVPWPPALPKCREGRKLFHYRVRLSSPKWVKVYRSLREMWEPSFMQDILESFIPLNRIGILACWEGA